ncbi:MAG: ABC transporter ATP-binding protein [Porticoccaceae bacterium]|nr:ABC transporter ATP-binding protein [Alphaproteobacteria bacterium]MDP4746035.1 ABC transporter ATP-binding protein [Porticoccaceae bacterium]MDP4751850.1 ABC transporter ATP-binding protein [Porticoccaceae bacterium]MDP4889172.1 ABC transporter ATP-binding protein [Porticoccaceae bacterium]MDP4986770.1 ABC transporter ATP-binding protein [Porticoccaceae bacterium]
MIKLTSINKTYQIGDTPLRALRDVSLNIDSGEYLSVMGPSGSGKSTLLNMIGLLDRPDSGSYLFDNVATEALKEERRARLRGENIGFIFQSFHLINRLTAFENVELPLILTEQPIKSRRQAVAEVLDMVGLSARASHKPNQLSGGQLQRVAIARAIVMRPRLLLADEPTGNLDSASGSEVIEVIERLNRDGITLVAVTHDQNLGDRATRHIRMVDGQIDSDQR